LSLENRAQGMKISILLEAKATDYLKEQTKAFILTCNLKIF